LIVSNLILISILILFYIAIASLRA